MMTIEAALHKHLTEHPQLAGTLGNRLYPINLPQAPTYPAMIYSRISGAREHSHDGSSGLAHPRIQFTCFGRTHAEAKEVGEGLRLALDGYRGIMGGAGGVDVNGAFLEDDDDGWDSELDVYWFRADYIIWHNEVTL